MKLDLEKLAKLQKKGDVQIIDMDPNGNYLLVADSRTISKEELAKIPPTWGIMGGITVSGKPDYSIAIYEIKDKS